MTAQKLWRPGTVLLVCVLVGAAASGQPQQSQPIAPPGVPTAPLVAPVPSLPPPAATQPHSPPTVDQLMDRLTNVRARKAELEREEQAVLKALRERLQQQKERLAKLGIEPAIREEAPPPPLVEPETKR